LREEGLIDQLVKLIDQMDVNELIIKHQIDLEFERYNKFQGMLGLKKSEQKSEPIIQPKAYAKYLLQSGSTIEKRQLLGSLKSKLILKDKTLMLLID
jgi:hypothetical protein